MAGLDKNINIGWHAQGLGCGECTAAFQKIVMPIANELNPDLNESGPADEPESKCDSLTAGDSEIEFNVLKSARPPAIASCRSNGENIPDVPDPSPAARLVAVA